MDRPLTGIRVLESALQYPGPYCGMLLSQLGAEVIKVEKPDIGDPARVIPPFFNSINANKKSITVDLKKESGKRIVFNLVKDADVFMEGFRPGVAKRLGIDYDHLSAINPGVIYCSISGYGQTGPYRDLPGHDINYQALSGMLQSCFKETDGKFSSPGIALGDVASGMFAAISILSACIFMKRTGKGQYIDVSMTDGLISLLSTHLGIFHETGETDRIKDPGYGIYKTSDKKFIALGIAYEDWFWERFCDAIGLETLRGMNGVDRRHNRDKIVPLLERTIRKKSQTEWVEILSSADVPVSAVNSLDRTISDPHIMNRKVVREIRTKTGEVLKLTNYPAKFSGINELVPAPPPALGEHTILLLREQGYSVKEIEQLKSDEVI